MKKFNYFMFQSVKNVQPKIIRESEQDDEWKSYTYNNQKEQKQWLQKKTWQFLQLWHSRKKPITFSTQFQNTIEKLISVAHKRHDMTAHLLAWYRHLKKSGRVKLVLWTPNER